MTKSLSWILLLAWILIPQQVVFANTAEFNNAATKVTDCLLYTSPSPRDATLSRMPSSA